MIVRWPEFQKGTFKVEGYELQMRELHPGGKRWVTVAPFIRGTEARKRNLKENVQYQFRVMPAKTARLVRFSSPSEVVSVTALSPGLTELFKGLPHNCLLQAPERSHIGLDTALSGKMVLLYASAGWNQACRIFTPQLMGFYHTHKHEVEIIFISCDRSETEFQQYFATMPWMAVPFGARLREKLLAFVKIQTVPRLVVLDRKGGIMIDHAERGKLDVPLWRSNPYY